MLLRPESPSSAAEGDVAQALEVAPVGVATVADVGSAAGVQAVAAAAAVVAVAFAGSAAVADAAAIGVVAAVVPKRAAAEFHLDVDRLVPVVPEAKAVDELVMNCH